jgi:hypothetical protein
VVDAAQMLERALRQLDVVDRSSAASESAVVRVEQTSCLGERGRLAARQLAISKRTRQSLAISSSATSLARSLHRRHTFGSSIDVRGLGA